MGGYPAITLYERENEEPGLGREGYSLSIRSDQRTGGMQALQKMGILDRLLHVSITGRQTDQCTFGVWDLQWRRIVEMRMEAPDNLPAPGLRIARWQLRRILPETVAKHANIRWGIACLEILPSLDAKIQRRLSNGRVEDCDFLLWRVRQAASSERRSGQMTSWTLLERCL